MLGRTEFEEAWRRRFRHFAQVHDDDAGVAGWSTTGLEARMRRFAAAWSGGTAGERWVDAGCGAGTYTRLLAARGHAAVGVDYSLPSIGKARSRDGSRARYLVADVTLLPVRTESLDGVLCFGVTQALSESNRLLSEMSRVLRVGGEAWLDGLNGWCVPHLWDRFWLWRHGRCRHLRYETPWELRRAMSRNGFANIDMVWVPILPRRYSRWQWVLETSGFRLLIRVVPVLGALLSHSVLLRGTRVQEA